MNEARIAAARVPSGSKGRRIFGSAPRRVRSRDFAFARRDSWLDPDTTRYVFSLAKTKVFHRLPLPLRCFIFRR